jgi:hypothetical protein
MSKNAPFSAKMTPDAPKGSLSSENLRNGLTIGGQPIILQATLEQNWLRCAISSANHRLCNLAMAQGDRTGRIVEIATALAANAHRAVHYGDNRPGSFSASGKPLLPAPRFTYFDLWQFGSTGEEGTLGLLRECGLPDSTSPDDLLVAVGLLLTDAAVAALDVPTESFAGFLLHQATECSEHATFIKLRDMPQPEALRLFEQMLSERGRVAGGRSALARQATVEPTYKEIRSAWATMESQGVPKRDRAAKLARRFNKTPDHIRKILKKPT